MQNIRLASVLATSLCLPALGIASPSAAQLPTAVSATPSWTLTWADEFNAVAGAKPSGTKWGYDLGGGGFGNAERQYYTNRAENVSTDGRGNLAITARRETLPGSSCWYGSCQYTSGRILTKNKFTQRYGRFEARMRLPAGQGVWPAFWMQGDDTGSGGTAWPGRGELDVMELIGREPSTVHGSLHGPGYSGGASISKSYTLPNAAKFADGFHTFAVEWAPNSVRWYVDGVLYQSRTPADLPPGKPWVFDHPFYLLLNFAVGGQWPGDPSAATVFPQSMLVDYVRAYSVTPTPAPTPTPTPKPTPAPTPTPTATPTPPPAPTRDARARIEAETFDAHVGVATQPTTDLGGGRNVGWIANGDSVTYRRVNFTGSLNQVQARVASGAAPGVSGAVEFHLDSATGPKVGEFSLAGTGGWQSWKTVPANVSGATGTHDLVVTFRSGARADFVNLNWFTFTGTR